LGIGEPLLGVAHLSLGFAATGSVSSFFSGTLELGCGRLQSCARLSGGASITRRGLQRLGRRG
jgi:hypothetical protein